jgi:hypothetical protein
MATLDPHTVEESSGDTELTETVLRDELGENPPALYI